MTELRYVIRNGEEVLQYRSNNFGVENCEWLNVKRPVELQGQSGHLISEDECRVTRWLNVYKTNCGKTVEQIYKTREEANELVYQKGVCGERYFLQERTKLISVVEQ